VPLFIKKTRDTSDGGLSKVSLKAPFPDPRVKAFMTVIVGAIGFMNAGKFTTIMVFCLAFCILTASKMYRTSLKALTLFAALIFLDWAIPFFGYVSLWTTMISFFIFIIIRFIPLSMMGMWFGSVRVSDLITALYNSNIPRSIVIPFAVMLRFIPTVRYEAQYIMDTMKMRDIEFTIKNILLHPLTSLEYIMVPLLLRTVKIADDIASSALTRGIDFPSQRSSLREIKLTTTDIAVTIGFCILIFDILYLEKAVFL
jgi:energy-coupling factor transport system permease protein